jgi:nucleoside-diphosphate-sugar epimerase
VSETILLTGCGGFLGSHVAERLLADGHTVVGVDSYSDQYYQYARVQKERNVARLKGRASFEFIEADITKVEPVSLMDGITAVYHFSGQVGARACWGRDFAAYARNNILATQLLLEASLQVDRFVLASSLHVYGNAPSFPCTEETLPRPISPYAASRLAAENVAYSYAYYYRVPTIALRIGSVYGPGQRPDMLFHKVIRSALDGTAVDIFGDGQQKRDFVFIDDAVEACVAALRKGGRGDTVNVAGGQPRTVREALDILAPMVDLPPERIRWQEPMRGDLPQTWADVSRAREVLEWSPATSLEDGLARQVAWMREEVAPAAR